MDEKPKQASQNPFKGLRSYERPIVMRSSAATWTLTLHARTALLRKDNVALRRRQVSGKTSFLKARLLPSVGTEFVTCYHHRWADEEPRTAVLRSIGRQPQ